ncbi:MAG TPA: formylglycine-generating enzyme family protein [Pirellulaceae bacterium]|nr:formylglycine-generating enzyme family protein [Pirellulaceae bacterium]HMO91482.1 formylglycine-generating enzyme family protein [Pirellulaceae bacterium]HMP70995.1 formylglycine-generating enzyme family protein [Pirellulaceae bacterium]
MRFFSCLAVGIAVICCSSCINQRVPAFRSDMTDYTNSIGMKFKRIEPGTFRMGALDNEPLNDGDEIGHQVKISKPFYMGVYEVTQSQYRQVMGKNPSYHQKGEAGERMIVGIDTANLPVDSVTYYDAIEFCKALNQLESGAPFAYRLPTEAEWEYACRAGTTTYFPFGDDLLHGEQANVRGTVNYPPQVPVESGKERFLGRPEIVGSYMPNDWGLYDMVGNVFEWVNDWYDKTYGFAKGEDGKLQIPELTIDPQGPLLGENASEEERKAFEAKYMRKVLRGGSWGYPPADARAANRKLANADDVKSTYGFRVVLVPKDLPAD